MRTQIEIRYNFLDGAFAEIVGGSSQKYLISFIDGSDGSIVYECEIGPGQWARASRRYFTTWLVYVRRKHDASGVLVHSYDCRGKRVLISIESKALGDTLAWFPAIEEFRKAHGCEMLCSTFHNDLFRDTYPEIAFLEPGSEARNLYALYRLGLFYSDNGHPDRNRNPRDVLAQPLAKAAFDILGLAYAEIRPVLPRGDRSPGFAAEYVCIAVHATAQAKYWNNPSGWTEVVAFLVAKGYQVLLLSKEGRIHMGNSVPAGVFSIPEAPLSDIANYLRHARLFVGVGSGLSWLSWAAGCKTCLISGFSAPYTEMKDCLRVFPLESVCTSCFNRQRLDASDWNWCPEHKNTPRMFECTKAITGEQVIDAIAPFL